MKCPNCRHRATIEHFRNSPDCGKAVASLCALYRASKRTTPPKPGPGRGKKGHFAERIERAPEQRKPQ